MWRNNQTDGCSRHRSIIWISFSYDHMSAIFILSTVCCTAASNMTERTCMIGLGGSYTSRRGSRRRQVVACTPGGSGMNCPAESCVNGGTVSTIMESSGLELLVHYYSASSAKKGKSSIILHEAVAFGA